MRSPPGYTLYATIGPYAGFGFRRQTEGRVVGRLVLGWLSIGLLSTDVELMLVETGKLLVDLHCREQRATRILGWFRDHCLLSWWDPEEKRVVLHDPPRCDGWSYLVGEARRRTDS